MYGYERLVSGIERFVKKLLQFGVAVGTPYAVPQG
jgi:hypothetical protein